MSIVQTYNVLIPWAPTFRKKSFFTCRRFFVLWIYPSILSLSCTQNYYILSNLELNDASTLSPQDSLQDVIKDSLTTDLTLDQPIIMLSENFSTTDFNNIIWKKHIENCTVTNTDGALTVTFSPSVSHESFCWLQTQNTYDFRDGELLVFAKNISLPTSKQQSFIYLLCQYHSFYFFIENQGFILITHDLTSNIKTKLPPLQPDKFDPIQDKWWKIKISQNRLLFYTFPTPTASPKKWFDSDATRYDLSQCHVVLGAGRLAELQQESITQFDCINLPNC